MSTNQDFAFYVGYLPKLPAAYRKIVSLSIVLIGLFVVLAAIFFGFAQTKLPNSQFEFGEQKELTGYLVTEPYPLLMLELGKNQTGKTLWQSVMLVSAGKIDEATGAIALHP